MATLNFPSNPTIGDIYEYEPYRYTWDGEKWKTIGIGYNPVNQLREDLNSVSGADVSIFDTETAKLKQHNSLANFIIKLQTDSSITIACRGDSLTYGQAAVTGTQAADTTPTQSGRTHTYLRAATTYPQALQTYLQSVFTGSVTVLNQGYSGDNTALGYADWFTDVGQDLTLVMYGTNDGSFGDSHYQTIDDFTKYYEKIIVREMLFDSAVVIMLPPQLESVTTKTRYVDSYRQAARALALKYNCPILDMSEVSRGFSSTVFDDTIHFKTAGYQKFATACAAFIISKFRQDFASVYHGSISSVRFEEGAIKHKLADWGVQTAKSSMKTPPLTSFTGGYVVETSTYSSPVMLAFYCATDDLVVQPSFILANASCSITLDEGLTQMQYELDDKVQEDIALITDTPVSSKTVSALNTSVEYSRFSDIQTQQSIRIHVAQKGWHILTLQISSNGSSSSPLLTLSGLSFQVIDSLKASDRVRFVRTGAIAPSGNVTPLFIGEDYLDTTSGAFDWYKATGLANTNWKLMTLTTSSLFRTGAAAPSGAVTPRFIGEDYLDTTSGQFVWYKATGLANTNWKQISN